MKRVAGGILAGGQARRMGGGDKCLLPLVGGRVVLDAIIARLAGQVDCLALNANGDAARFGAWALPVLQDSVADAGPLAGVLAAMDWAAAQGCARVVTVAGDTPFFPDDLVAQLAAGLAAGGGGVAMAKTDRVHPVFALWDVALAPALRSALDAGTRRVQDFAHGQAAVEVVFPVAGGGDPFFNINTPEDLVRAQARAIAGGGM
ncbi:MAG: molybdenum cofactor guanylyltransferase [Rhodobacterales bacterium 34-62-10]|nr:MAG: molybdenum cofactor guanylyltransferase [Rhodobacterales bacterium 34-62-10]